MISSISAYIYSLKSPLYDQLGEHCSELKDIHLGQCYSITDEGMVALAKGCPKLQRLYMQENKLVSPTPPVLSSVWCVSRVAQVCVCASVNVNLLSVFSSSVMYLLKTQYHTVCSIIISLWYLCVFLCCTP